MKYASYLEFLNADRRSTIPSTDTVVYTPDVDSVLAPFKVNPACTFTRYEEIGDTLHVEIQKVGEPKPWKMQIVRGEAPALKG